MTSSHLDTKSPGARWCNPPVWLTTVYNNSEAIWLRTQGRDFLVISEGGGGGGGQASKLNKKKSAPEYAAKGFISIRHIHLSLHRTYVRMAF